MEVLSNMAHLKLSKYVDDVQYSRKRLMNLTNIKIHPPAKPFADILTKGKRIGLICEHSKVTFQKLIATIKLYGLERHLMTNLKKLAEMAVLRKHNGVSARSFHLLRGANDRHTLNGDSQNLVKRSVTTQAYLAI